MLELNTKERKLYKDGQEIPLTRGEHNLLIVFYTMGDRLLNMDTLIELTLDNPVKVPQDKGRINSLILRIRKKIGPDVIVNKKNVGYRLAEEIQIVN